ncbi:hypothetical protein [Absidia glauca]|uniref:Ndc10 domain-containing protein n=1 Tax=Absidia glauca TaxID=4829 RepID=A0A163JD94_ABSGL|nr:hypothetical protein [Absidia glauca]
MKIKPPRQAPEWSYSSHRESIGMALSSPGIRSNKNTHINCGSSARMVGNVCANVDQLRRQGRWNNTTGRFFYIARAALNPPTSLCGHDVQEDFYTRLGAHDGTPPPAIPFGNIQSSLIQPICHPKSQVHIIA